MPAATADGRHGQSTVLVLAAPGPTHPHPNPTRLLSCLSVAHRWVRCVAFDPSNEWFCTGSSDRTIKLWDTGSGQLKLTLTGHIEQVTGLAVSPRHPYMFSCSLDKEVKCWDLEHNKVGGQGVVGWGWGISSGSRSRTPVNTVFQSGVSHQTLCTCVAAVCHPAPNRPPQLTSC